MVNTLYKIGFYSLLLILVGLFARRFYHQEQTKEIRKQLSLEGWEKFEKEGVNYFVNRDQLFQKLSIDSNDVVFLGDSHTQFFELGEYNLGFPSKNRGINGDITLGVLRRLGPILKGKPKTIVLLIGTNDLYRRLPVFKSIETIGAIIQQIHQNLPNTKIVLHTVFPINEEITPHPNFNSKVIEFNSELKQFNKLKNVQLIDLYTAIEQEGQLNKNYTFDGIHLNHKGYLVWKNLLIENLSK